MLGKTQQIYDKLMGQPCPSAGPASPEAVIWGYRLFLDREPESALVVEDKLKHLASTQDIRRVLLCSPEFKQNNSSIPSFSLSGNEPALFVEKVAELSELFFHIQKVWEQLGESEPHWSVVTAEQFKASGFDDKRASFYSLGQNEVAVLFNTLERNGIDAASLKTCLEYGCGVGRVTGWLAKRFERVLGYDISRGHLRIARQYLDDNKMDNVSLHHVGSPEDIRDFPRVDLVYSVIVLQHNPPPIMRLIIQEFMRALRPGGIAFFQVPTYRLGYRFSLKEYLANEGAMALMEMHVLPQNEVFDIVHQEKGKVVEVLEDGFTGLRYGERSNTFIIQKE